MQTIQSLLKAEILDLIKDDLKAIVKEAYKEMQSEGMTPAASTKDVDILDRRQAAKLLNISLPTLDQYTKDEIITGRRIGKKILYRRDELLNAGQTIATIKHRKRYDVTTSHFANQPIK
jgi:hypothetical protein